MTSENDSKIMFNAFYRRQQLFQLTPAGEMVKSFAVQYCEAGSSTVKPSSAAVSVIWQLRRLLGWRGAAVKASMASSSASGVGRLDAKGSATMT